MSFTITVESKCEAEWAKFSNSAHYCFSRAYDGKKSKYDDILRGKTIRVLSIDLGLKQFGACAVGNVEYGNDLVELPPVHFERMFMLRLPNEKVDTATDKSRVEAMKEIWRLKSEIKYLALIKHIYGQDKDGREKLLAKSAEYYNHPDKKTTLLYCLNIKDVDKVNECLKDEYSRVIGIMND